MTVDEIIAALGGPKKAQETLGVSRSAVSMWRLRKALPPRHVPAVAQALRVPPAAVWPALREPTAPSPPHREAA